MKPHCANCFAPLPSGGACPPGRGCYPPDREALFQRAMLRSDGLEHATRIREGLEVHRAFKRLPRPTILVRA